MRHVASHSPNVNRHISHIIERCETADMDDGQPLPPFHDQGVIWRVVSRSNGRTIWQRVLPAVQS
jgi:hypothetical protein